MRHNRCGSMHNGVKNRRAKAESWASVSGSSGSALRSNQDPGRNLEAGSSRKLNRWAVCANRFELNCFDSKLLTPTSSWIARTRSRLRDWGLAEVFCHDRQ